ncbi:hypothetical protein [Bacillus sp. JJ722]|uniref:hypothetical protein n=1 Tax=Bacillus sp. JJ722 TaxID=3122973 RepID=UPI002FFE6FD7
MKYFKHYKASLGFIPSIIAAFAAIGLAIIENEIWILVFLLSAILQIYGVSFAKNYYEQLENVSK